MPFDPDLRPDVRPGFDRDWRTHWARLAPRVGLEPDEPLVVALSGGADSVLLLHLAARAAERPAVHAVHVDHGLRGSESTADAEFCERLCGSLDVPFSLRRLELDPLRSDLEARARRARYAALAEEARRLGVRAVATGHHADDSLETLVQRWLRGTELAGLSGIEPRVLYGSGAGAVAIVRPLIDLLRVEVRAMLAQAGLDWREDSSNRDPRFTRSRIRNALLPQLARASGPTAIENLRAFAHAVARLERELAARTAHLAWQPPTRAAAGRSRSRAHLGGTLRRAELTALTPSLRRRALWRLLTEGTGRAPSRRVLDLLLLDLETGRCTRRALGGAWMLQLRSELLHLSPPRSPESFNVAPERHASQLAFPFAPADDRADGPGAGLPLHLPGLVALPDGRAISAELAAPAPGSAVPRSPVEVELDAAALRGELRVRWPRPGDRFHALGAPGSRPLSRFLADAGVPWAERCAVPLVFDEGELVWVAGLRPADSRRVRRETTRRLRLVLHGAARERPPHLSGGLFGER